MTLPENKPFLTPSLTLVTVCHYLLHPLPPPCHLPKSDKVLRDIPSAKMYSGFNITYNNYANLILASTFTMAVAIIAKQCSQNKCCIKGEQTSKNNLVLIFDMTSLKGDTPYTSK